MKHPLIVSIALGITLGLAGCTSNNPVDPGAQGQPEISPKTFVLTSANDSRLPAPLIEDQSATDQEREMVKTTVEMYRNSGASQIVPSIYWNLIATTSGTNAKLPPPLLSRTYALVHVAIYDALVAAHTTNRHDLVDNAVAAGAASKVLYYLFPQDSALISSRIPSQLIVEHGLAIGRVLRSWVLGRVVGQLVVQHGKVDGSDAVFTDTIPRGDGIWTGTNPVLPMCGTWKTWIIDSSTEFQPEPPYPFGSHADSVDVAEVYDTSLHRTPEEIAIVHKWADISPPTIWCQFLNDRVMTNHLGNLRAARAHSYLSVAMYDAFVSCWKTKYIYWVARPFQRIPGLVTVIPTPNFPSYTSGHSTISATAADVMGEVFPVEADFFASEANEAAFSRLLGGIHFRHDNEQGLVVGHQIGAKVVGVMHTDARAPIFVSN